MKLISLLISCLILLLSYSRARAEGVATFQKSENVALFLALDPIPGDALFYAGQHRQAVLNLIVGGAGGAAFYSGAVALMKSGSSEDNRAMAKWALGIGSLIYFPALIWDAVVGLRSVRHEKRIESKVTASGVGTLRPRLMYASRRVYGGLELTF